MKNTPCPNCGSASRIHPVNRDACDRFEWKPISTAPKMGETLLVFGPHAEAYTAYYDWVQESFCDRINGEICEPSWWMPLPKNPPTLTAPAPASEPDQ